MKAIASDFDGTIYFENQLNKFNKADLEAIRIYQKKVIYLGCVLADR